MQPRALMILLGSLCLGAAAGIAFLSQESLAVELPPGAGGGPAPAAPAVGSGGATADADTVDAGADAVGPVAAVATAESATRQDTTGWTKGVIRGDIQLAVSTLDRLGSITVFVEEMRSAFDHGSDSARPNRYYVSVERDRGTPTFEVTGVEFSGYPYQVTVHAPGLNGSQRTVIVDAEHPLVDDVVLSITPGAPFSVLLRDQDGAAHTGVEVRMNPIDTPLGRPRHLGTSDSFGSVVFEDVLAGDYELSTWSDGQPLGTVQRVTVQPGTRMFHSKVQGQGHVLTIPRGVELNLQIHDAAGYGIGGAKVTATATDRVRLTSLEAIADAVGRVHFPHLQPGIWQVTVECDKFQRVDQQITLKPDQAPEQRSIKLVRTRW